jgi:hypothetical protein
MKKLPRVLDIPEVEATQSSGVNGGKGWAAGTNSSSESLVNKSADKHRWAFSARSSSSET